MAVLIKVKADIYGKEETVTVFLPKNKILTPEERQQAENLDEELKRRIPQIDAEMREKSTYKWSALKKWHELGKKLQFLESLDCVKPSDFYESRIWLAIRNYCPPNFLPRSAKVTDVGVFSNTRREGKKHDHLEFCFKLGKHAWKDIAWIGTWVNWITIVESPSLLSDQRILPLIRKTLEQRDVNLNRKQFLSLAKHLRKCFPYDNSVSLHKLSLENIEKRIKKSVGSV